MTGQTLTGCRNLKSATWHITSLNFMKSDHIALVTLIPYCDLDSLILESTSLANLPTHFILPFCEVVFEFVVWLMIVTLTLAWDPNASKNDTIFIMFTLIWRLVKFTSAVSNQIRNMVWPLNPNFGQKTLILHINDIPSHYCLRLHEVKLTCFISF